MERHIAWDIGISAVTRGLADALDATAILQTLFAPGDRLQPPPSVPSAFPEVSEATPIPGNIGLSAADKLARRQAIFDPYHAEIERLIAARQGGGRFMLPCIVSRRSIFEEARGMHVAVLYQPQPALPRICWLRCCAGGAGLVVEENKPYRVTDETDYGVPVHAERGGLDYIELEIRQDLIQMSRTVRRNG